MAASAILTLVGNACARTVLLIVVLIGGSLAAAIEPAAAKGEPDRTVSEIKDPRITESSALAVSVKHDDLVYTVNDQGNHPVLFAIQLSTGDVVGETDLSSLSVQDTESLAVDADGTLWLGDLGDNDTNRDDVSILSFPEPGPGDHEPESVERYPVDFPHGPVDVEGMLVQPATHRVRLAAKTRHGLGTIYALPPLSPGVTAHAVDTGIAAPRAVSDATYTHDGAWALLRTNDDIWVYDTTTWQPVQKIKGPDLVQGESIAVEAGDTSFLVGTEGENSPIVRLPLPDLSGTPGPIELDDGTPGMKFEPVPTIGVLVVGLVLAAVLLVRRYRPFRG